jgi:NCS1 family nucleobase:cation symporter-1
MLASGLIDPKIGMNWSQAIGTIFLANVIVLIPMVLNAHAGTLYGIPFPVYCRASFGTLGANVPALLRALVACGWFGIQTWIGGDAIYKILSGVGHLGGAIPLLSVFLGHQHVRHLSRH